LLQLLYIVLLHCLWFKFMLNWKKLNVLEKALKKFRHTFSHTCILQPTSCTSRVLGLSQFFKWQCIANPPKIATMACHCGPATVAIYVTTAMSPDTWPLHHQVRKISQFSKSFENCRSFNKCCSATRAPSGSTSVKTIKFQPVSQLIQSKHCKLMLWYQSVMYPLPKKTKKFAQM
jgi:hypothetical protein